jgi:8-oxo-dGTP diphosphatase
MTLPSSVVGLFHDSSLGKVLAVSRRGSSLDLGFPGGKIDPGESPEEAVIREIREEVGVTALGMRFIYERVDGATGHIAWCYLVQAFEGEPRAMEPETWVGWVKVSDLLTSVCMFREYNLGLFNHLGWVWSAERVRAEVDLSREKWEAELRVGQPPTWSADRRTRDLWCLGKWLAGMIAPEEDRRAYLWYFNRKARAEEDLFALAGWILGRYTTGEGIEPEYLRTRRG